MSGQRESGSAEGPIRATGSDVEALQQRRLWAAVEHLASIAFEGSSEDFLHVCVEKLADAYGAAYAMVGVFADRERTRIRSRAYWTPQGAAGPIEYSLVGTPCADVLSRRIEVVERDLGAHYPEDRDAAALGLESYIGAPLVASSGEAIGVVVVAHTAPMRVTELARSVLGLYASRLAAELERETASATLRAREAHYRRLAERSRDLIIVHNLEGTMLFVNPATERFLGRNASSLVGLNVREVISPQCVADLERRAARRIGGERSDMRYEIDLVRRDGELTRVEVISTVLSERGTELDDRILLVARDVSERRHTLDALRASRQKYKDLVHALPEIVFEVDTAGRLTFVNRTGLRAFGIDPEDLARGLTVVDTVIPQDAERVRAEFERVMQGEELGWQNYTARRKNGATFPMSVHAQPIGLGAHGSEVRGARGIAVDNTQREAAEAELRLSASVFENSIEGILITDPQGTILRANRAATTITGYPREELLGQTPRLFRSDRHDERFYSAMWSIILETGSWHGEIWNTRKSGEVYPQWLSISTVRGPDGEPTHYIAVFSDISSQKRFEERIHRLAHYDPLTDLPNRRLFQDRLEHALAQARRDNGQVALLYLDVDRFKSVNDSLGHAVGDQLLQQVSDRLRRAVRESDTVARLGGDEFTVILRGFDNPAAAVAGAVRVAQQVIHSVRVPMILEGHDVAVTVSIGIALYPQDASSAHDLVMNADTAMYHAKGAGRNDYRFYAQEMNASAKARLIMEGHLRRAAERGEFELYYQPRVDVRSNHVLGYEALLRWSHDSRTLAPGHFMGLLEESGLIIEVGEWVVTEACRQLRHWHAQGRDGLRMAINLSPKQFFQEDLAGRLRDIIEASGVPPATLEFEITESSLLGDETGVMAVLAELKRIGVSIAIDDFGTGYSSLSYLKRLPIDTLKVDRSFVGGIPDDADDTAITSAIVALGHSLKLRVVAEGVETEAQLAVLRELGCDEYQGYLFERPLPAGSV